MVTGANGCTSTATAEVLLDNDVPEVDALSGVLSCSNPTVTLNGFFAPGIVSFQWTGPNGFVSADAAPVVSTAGVYTLTVTAANGCSNSASTTVLEDVDVPGAQAAGGTLTCTTTSVMLMGSGNGSYSWTGPNNFASIDQNPTVSVAGTYVLTVTGSNGCTSTASAEVLLDNAAPGAQAAGGTIPCTTVRVTLQGTGNGSFSWTGPGNYSSADPNPTVCMAGTYTLVVTGANGCTSTATAEVLLDNDVPEVDALSGVLSCSNPTVTLNGFFAPGIVSFQWTGPNGFVSADAAPVVSTAGVYTLTVTAANGCSNSASTTVLEDVDVPGAQAAGGTITCTTSCVTLQGTGNGSYSWTGPGNYSSADQDPTVCTAGTYTLVVTGANGCTSTASAEVLLDNAAPGAQATGGTLTCTTTSVMLMGSGNGSYSWTGPNNFASIDQNPTVSVAGTYVLTVTGSNGCTSTASAEVLLDNAAPGAQAAGGTITCTTSCVTLQGTGNGSFSWTGPGNYSSADPNPTVCMAGTYTLVVTGANGCTSTATAEVLLDNDVPEVDALSGVLSCSNPTVTLNGFFAPGIVSFQWTGPQRLRERGRCPGGEHCGCVHPDGDRRQRLQQQRQHHRAGGCGRAGRPSRRWHDHLHHELRDAAGHGQRQLQLDRPGQLQQRRPEPDGVHGGHLHPGGDGRQRLHQHGHGRGAVGEQRPGPERRGHHDRLHHG
ncbi:MAG: hypothetical protein IPO79_15900 [Flavobacteriales bacterium]|nr:hypothetical protein [Flavobacteriales bacterium]